MHLNCTTGDITHHHFYNLINLVTPNDLLVFNNTKVIPARLHGKKDSGGRVEILVERILDDKNVLAQIKSSKSPKQGSTIALDNSEYLLTVKPRQDTFFHLQFPNPGVDKILTQVGRIPLPPYIDRPDENLDKERYQTVYASKDGAIAAPTAGLHFDKELLQKLTEKGVGSTHHTLHVGAGTFQPLRVDDPKKHQMHKEQYEIDDKTCETVNTCKQSEGRVIAVGTTSVRTLESSASDGQVHATKGETDIFIYPGYNFQIVDALITNFHLPESTLIMLTSAFAGLDNIQNAYKIAVKEKYRFFSYGDAMLITK